MKCRKAAEEADAALKLAKNDRAALIVAMDSSESENESMDVEEEISNSGWYLESSYSLFWFLMEFCRVTVDIFTCEQSKHENLYYLMSIK